MLHMIQGCKVPNCTLLEEQYQATEYGFCANVDVHKIENVMRSFILLQKSPYILYFGTPH